MGELGVGEKLLLKWIFQKQGASGWNRKKLGPVKYHWRALVKLVIYFLKFYKRK
jgi:hypothetical protein